MTNAAVGRFKKRKVRKGLKIEIACDGSKHSIYLTPKGHVVLANHPDIDLEAEMALNGLGGAHMCRCAAFLQAWRYANCNMYSSVMPRTLDRVRADDSMDILGDRLWARWAKKKRYANRHIKRVWPTGSGESLEEFFSNELTRVGLKMVPTKADRAPGGQGTIRIDHNRLKGKITLYIEDPLAYWPFAANRAKPDVALFQTAAEVYLEDYKKLYITSWSSPGMTANRLFNNSNFDMGINLIGRGLWREAARKVSGYYKQKVSDRVAADVRRISEKFDKEKLITLKSDSETKTLTLHVGRSLEEIGSLPHIVSSINTLLKRSSEAVKGKPDRYKDCSKIWDVTSPKQ